MVYVRKQFNTLKERILEPRKFMQVLAGPRQVGKSTLVGQVLETCAELPTDMDTKKHFGENMIEAWLLSAHY